MSVSLQFCGAAGTVTGSCYWLRAENCQFLVDCGMFQGSKTLKALNYGAFPFDPKAIDFVLITHAHADHAALLPKLYAQGFRGPVYLTAGSRDLLAFMLPDSAYIQETEVAQLNRRNLRRGVRPVAPIYTADDAARCQEQFRCVDYERWVEPGDGIRARFWNAGHILGAASIELEIAVAPPPQRRLRLLFSGDIGPEHKLFHPDPQAPNNFDYVICESTYGGRVREDASPTRRRAVLADEINQAMARNGTLVIPAFAVERTQELLLDLAALLDDGAIPAVPVFLDSPLAIRVTSAFGRHLDALEDVEGPANPFSHPSFHFTGTVEESKAINRYSGPKIVLAASGMCEAGRVRHHLKEHLWRDNATVLIVGYQAPGTLGALLLAGAKAVRIQGEPLEVHAQIRSIDVYSGHADGDQLIAWMRERLPIKRAVFLTHGEADALAALRQGLEALGLPPDRILVPQLDDVYDLLASRANAKIRKAPRRLDPKLVGKPDWHNDLAQFTLDLRAQLDQAAGDKRRQALLRRLRRVLERQS